MALKFVTVTVTVTDRVCHVHVLDGCCSDAGPSLLVH